MADNEHVHTSLRCRTGHHAWADVGIEDGELHRHCKRCGADEYEAASVPTDAAILRGNMAQGISPGGG